MAGGVIGIAGSMFLGSRQSGRKAGGGRSKALIVALAIGGFGWCVSVIAPPVSFAQSEAIAEAWRWAAPSIRPWVRAPLGGLRLSAVGAAIMVGTVAGWLFAREVFFLWMAVAGGGGLILGGLWFRKV